MHVIATNAHDEVTFGVKTKHINTRGEGERGGGGGGSCSVLWILINKLQMKFRVRYTVT